MLTKSFYFLSYSVMVQNGLKIGQINQGKNVIPSRNHSLDALKFLMALFVVIEHCKSVYHDFVFPITICAVPCFFMISGYLIYQGIVTKDRYLKSVRRILKIFVFSSITYYIAYFLIHSFEWYQPSLKDIIVFLTINDVAFAGHLWYLSAYLYVLFFIYILYAIKKEKLLKVLVPVLVIIYCGFDLYSILNHSPRRLTIVFLFRSWLFTGLPFFMLGAFISRTKEYMLMVSHKVVIIILVTIMYVAIIEQNILGGINHVSDIYFTTWFFSFLLFWLFLYIEFPKNNIFAVIGEKYSLYIYIIHPIIVVLVKQYVRSETVTDYCQPFLVFTISLIISILFVATKVKITKIARKL